MGDSGGHLANTGHFLGPDNLIFHNRQLTAILNIDNHFTAFTLTLMENRVTEDINNVSSESIIFRPHKTASLTIRHTFPRQAIRTGAVTLAKNLITVFADDRLRRRTTKIGLGLIDGSNDEVVINQIETIFKGIQGCPIALTTLVDFEILFLQNPRKVFQLSGVGNKFMVLFLQQLCRLAEYPCISTHIELRLGDNLRLIFKRVLFHHTNQLIEPAPNLPDHFSHKPEQRNC